ncbi:unnamed protein product [Mytilus edulis]|uniref:Uncharacterized protein n=1 Tax=Mytilus edulis TaxID=6550 RepID=A0A8S3T462_MYTED|nr:unnamed protein product [Mytilus edulis]
MLIENLNSLYLKKQKLSPFATKLITAARSGDIEAVKLCLQNAADIDYQDFNGWTALTSAAWEDTLRLYSCFLTEVSKRNQIKIWETALMLSAWRGHLEVTRLLLDRGVTETSNQYNNGSTALHLAAEKGNLQVIRYLVEQASISPFVKTHQDKTPCDLAAVKLKECPSYKNVVDYLQSVMSKNGKDGKDLSPKTSGNILETPIADDEVPNEIKLMTDKRSVELYLKLLESGSEKKRDIRLVVVGKRYWEDLIH